MSMIIDFHSHVLPACDHGSSGLSTSKKQVEMSHDAGVDILFLSQAEQFQKKIDLQKRLTAGDGDTAVSVEGAVVLILLDKRCGVPHVPALHIPGIRVMAVLTAHGTSLQENHKPHTGAIHSAEAFCGMNVCVHVRSVRGRYGK